MLPDPEPPSLPPVEAAVATDQIAAQATGAHGGHGPVHTHCENCGSALQGPFCHRCGQHDFDFHVSFGHVFHEALENFFHFDAKLFRDVVTLLFQPGRLSANFNAGRRASQVPPLRLYIFVSLIFFLVSFAGPNGNKGMIESDRLDPGQRTAVAGALQEMEQAQPAGSPAAKRLAEAGKKLRAERDDNEDAPAAKPARKHQPEGAVERALEEKGEFIYRHQHEVAEAFVHAIPKMLLFCLPFFALYTRVLFRKSGQAYLQHLVVALHFHTFIFLWTLFRDGWTGLARLLSGSLGGWVYGLATLWLLIYPLLMLRRLYGNPWPRTLLKAFALLVAYGLTLGLAFLVTGLIVVAMI